MLRRSCLLACFSAAALIVLPCVAAAQSQPPDRAAGLRTAFARVQHLRHGINASEWFAQSPNNYSASRLSAYTDDADIALMAKLGFDNVRLSIDPVPLEQSFYGRGFNSDFLARLDHAVDTMIAAGLAVQIDVHPQDPYKQDVRNSNQSVERFVMLWRQLAAHYANRNPDMVFFEVMNEPEVSDPYRWAGIQAAAAAAIREVAPNNTIIATGPNYSDIQDLLTQHPLPDGNVIYNFHFYDPHQFTHQAATWGEPWWSYTHNIPYPSTTEDMQASLDQVPDLRDRFELEQYFLDHWDATHIRLLIDEAAAWGKANNVPLICNEFGAHRAKTDPPARMAWIHDVRSALEADGIGWTMWDYRGSFGVVFKQNGQPATVDDKVVEALGLKGK